MLFATASASAAETVPLYLNADRPGLAFDVEGVDLPVVRHCEAPCALHLPPGRYTVLARGRDVYVRKNRVHLVRPLFMDVEVGSRDLRNTGLGLGITGCALFGGGFFMFAVSAIFKDPHAGVWGAVLMGSGLVMAGVGWPIFGSYRLKVTTRKVGAVSPQLMAVPLPGGAALTASGVF